MTEARLRFAPSPTGDLHVGNARTALFNWLLARRLGGRLILRIEDTDCDRCSPDSERAILRDLRWLGLDWDEGPDVGGPVGPYRQSDRLEEYSVATEALLRSGAAYCCFCTPEDLRRAAEERRAVGKPPRYPGTCRDLPQDEVQRRTQSGQASTIRFRVPTGEIRYQDLARGEIRAEGRSISDFALRRSDGWPMYNLAVVVDDVAMRITHVLRGMDHSYNTFKQILVAQALGIELPRFGHLPLVVDQGGGTLSKRLGGFRIAELREQGIPQEAVIHQLALLGWSPPCDERCLKMASLPDLFDPSRLCQSPGLFDPEQLRTLARRHLAMMTDRELIRRARPWLEAAPGWAPSAASRLEELMVRAAPLARERMSTLADAPKAMEGLVWFQPLSDPDQAAMAEIRDDPSFPELIRSLSEELLLERPYPELIAELKCRTGRKGRGLFHPLRLALTGRLVGPRLEEMMEFVRWAHREAPDLIPPLGHRLDETRRALEEP